MTAIVTLLCVAIWLATARTSGALSPAGAFAGINAGSALTFFLFCRILDSTFYDAQRWQLASTSYYSEVGLSVAAWYTTLCLVALAAAYWSRRPARGQRSPATKHLARRFTTENLGNVASLPVVGMCLLLVNLAFLIHALDLDWQLVWHHSQYLLLKNPDSAGLTLVPTRLAHRFLGIGSAVFAVLATLYYFRHAWSRFALAAPLAAYCNLLTLASASRWPALSIVLAGMTAALLRPRRARILLPLVATLSFAAYSMAIYARRYEELGLQLMAGNLRESFLSTPDMFVTLMIGVFGGGFVNAEALLRDYITYPLSYKLLSFSPLLSFIDGFDSVRDVQHRVNASAPFNNFAEAYHFGAQYLVFYVGFLYWSLLHLTRFWRRHGSRVGFVISAPALFVFFNMNFYPLRNSFRILLYSTLLAILVDLYTRGRLPLVQRVARVAGHRFTGTKRIADRSPSMPTARRRA